MRLIPLLVEILSLESKGLWSLRINSKHLQQSHFKSLARLILRTNRFIKMLEFYDENSYSFSSPLLTFAIERNKRLQSEIQKAAFKILNAARVILHGSPATSPSSSRSRSGRHSGRAPPADLSSSLLPRIFSFIFPGALSGRQIDAVVRFAADRGDLAKKSREWLALNDRAVRDHLSVGSGFDLEKEMVSMMLVGEILEHHFKHDRRMFLERIGCDEYDFEN